MSTYEKYDSVAVNYDKGRKAVGLELYHGFLATQAGVPFDKVHLLDAGCGTGNYSEYLLRKGIGKITLLDASEGMMGAAQIKLKKYTEEGRAEFKLAKMPELPYEDNTFDAVMCNFVLHHLEDGTDPEFKNTFRAFQEMFRVLKPGGFLVMQEMSHYQLRQCCWYVHLFPEELWATIAPHLTDDRVALDLIKKSGFDECKKYVIAEEMISDPETYHDYEGPWKKEWRTAMASGYSLFSPEQLSEHLQCMDAMKKDGSFERTVADCEERRVAAGLVYDIVGRKPRFVRV